MTGPATRLEIRRPNGRLLGCCPPSIRATGPSIAEQSQQLGLRITARTPELLGYTYKTNYDEAIQALLDAERKPVRQ